MAHEKVYAVCENMCMEETLTKEQIEDKFACSDEEVVVGKWINGKPIYRRIVETSIISTNTMTYYDDPDFVRNTLDKVVKLEGFLYASAWRTIPMNSYNGDSSYTYLTMSNRTTFAMKSSEAGQVMIIVEYTKTTDTADV